MPFIFIHTAMFFAAIPLESDTALARFEKVLAPMAEALNAGDYTAMSRDFDDTMKKAVPPAKLAAVFNAVKAQGGPLTRIGRGRAIDAETAVFPLRFERGLMMDLRLNLDAKGRVIGLLIVPPETDIPAPEKHETKLSLPFRGGWFVYWGGDTKELNYHHDVRNQRRALDFLMVDTAGSTHRGGGRRNEDYYCFGQEVLAPADGAVTDVITGVRDNVPGR